MKGHDVHGVSDFYLEIEEGDTVRLPLNERDYIDVKISDDGVGLTIRGSESIGVLPQVSNVVDIKIIPR